MPDPEIPKKDEQLQVRVHPEIKTRIAAVYRQFGVRRSDLVRDAIEALLDYVERAGGYRKPLRVISAGDYDESATLPGARAVAEDGADDVPSAERLLEMALAELRRRGGRGRGHGGASARRRPKP